MTAAIDMSRELAALRAELEQERLARVRAEAKLEGFREAVALFAQARSTQAPLHPERHAGSVTEQRDGVTPSVTQEEKKERERQQARVRSQAYRLRKRSVTEQRDGVTPSVTQAPSHPLPPLRPVRGTLAIVTAAARDAQRGGPREHRTPATLPAEVAELRAAWNELVAPHGFPAWGERTSGRLLEDAQAALERRPLEEWRRVFALVPRSPVCRGELNSRQRASLVWLLAGKCRDGYEPAEKLLSGHWSIDPEPGSGAPATEAAAPEGLAGLPEDTPAASAWKQMLEALHADGRDYALRWLSPLRAREVAEGELVLVAPDRYAADWVSTHYGELVRRMAEVQGFSGVRFSAPEGEGTP